jgi:hypothetical protein
LYGGFVSIASTAIRRGRVPAHTSSHSKRGLPGAHDLKRRKARKIRLAKNYNFVIVAYSSKEG